MTALRKHRRTLIAAVVLIVTLTAVFLITLKPRFTPPVKVSFSSFKAGNFRNLMYSDHFCIAFVTNVSQTPIVLSSGRIQVSMPGGKVITDMNAFWEGKASEFNLSPNQVVALAVPTDKQAVNYRIMFDYSGPQPPRGIVDASVRRLPKNIVPPATTRWLQNHGLLRPPMNPSYVSPWIPNAPPQTNPNLKNQLPRT